jgi:hypothetical protein
MPGLNTKFSMGEKVYKVNQNPFNSPTAITGVMVESAGIKYCVGCHDWIWENGLRSKTEQLAFIQAETVKFVTAMSEPDLPF